MRRLAPLLVTCVCMLAGSCGGKEERPAKARSLTVQASAGLRVVAREYSFDPAKVVVTGRGPLKITLDNRGTLAHDLKVVKGGHELGGTPTFSGGRAQSGSVTLTPGRYEFICTVGDHAKLGMRGRLDVEG